MECIAVGSPIQIESSESPISFQTSGSENWKVWDRYLCIKGKRAFHIGNICDTCAFFFEGLEGATQKISAREVSNALRNGLQDLDSFVVDQLTRLLPAGKFTPILWRWKPSHVTPGTTADYFSKEQIDTWGIDAFWGMPHNPKAEYYRVPVSRLDKATGLFHFGIPIYPHNWLDQKTVNSYQNCEIRGTPPTSVAISILDVKEPACGSEASEFSKHYCFAHYIIDGHHKSFAAASTNSVLTLLSFVAHEKGVSLDGDVQRVLSHHSRNK
jgi:hypothetical protein